MRSWKLIFILLLFSPAWAQTQQDAALLSACQFFAGSPLTAGEQQAILQEAQADFARDPAAAANDIAQLRQLGAHLSQLRDITQLVGSRQAALFSLYQDQQAGKATASTRIVLKKASPLAVDPQNQLLLLADDLNGVTQYMSFMRQSQGGSAFSAAETAQFQKSVVAGFAGLPAESKVFLVHGRVLWAVVSHNLQRMSQTQQANFQQQLSRQAPAGSMDWSTYQALSNMSRNQHLTTMNILENMGGTGDYWTVQNERGW